MSSGERAFTVATASRIRSIDECFALPFVENERNATLGSVSKKIRAFPAASSAISDNWPTVGTGTTAQSANRKLAEGRVIRKKLDTVLDVGLRPMQWIAARTVSAVVVAAPPTKPSASPARTIAAAKYIGFSSRFAASISVMPRDFQSAKRMRA